MLIIGESINSAIPAVSAAIAAKDQAFIAGLAQRQVECGAQMLDVFAALPERDQAADLVWAVDVIQQAVEVPLVLDSTDPQALRAAVTRCKTLPLLSSVTGEKPRLAGMLPLAAESGCGLVALCMDEQGIPGSAGGRLKVAETLTRRAAAAGIQPGQLWFDPMVLGIGTDSDAGNVTLDTARLIRQNLPGVHTLAAVSNVSFGMPHRRLLNRTFLAMLAAAGVEGLMVDVRDGALMSALRAAAALVGQDAFCREYLRDYRAGRLR